MRLYELSAAFSHLESLLAESDEVPENLAAEMDALDIAWETKVQSVCQLVQQLKADADAAEAEAARLRTLARVRENTAARLKDYLKSCMVERGLERCETPLFKIRLQQNSRPSIKWTGDTLDIPERYKRVTVEADLAAAYDAWKVGALPEGFEVTLGNHVRIV